MVCDGLEGRRDDDDTGILIVQGDGLLVLEGGRSPVVQHHVQLVLGLARRLEHLLIGQRLVLVESQSLRQVGGSVNPLVAIFLLGIFLQVGGLHDLRLNPSDRSTDTEEHGQHPFLHHKLLHF